MRGGEPTALLTGVGIDEAIARYTSAGNRTQLTDALGSVIAEARDDGSIATRYAYTPYGLVMQSGEPSANSTQYTGRENDATGLLYHRARYYDPLIKRFVSEDPIGLAGGLNLYSYAESDPLSNTDPLGLIAGGVARVGAAAMAACMKIKACKGAVERAAKFCKNVECRFERHPAHHYFPGLGYCEHYSLTCWEKGVGQIFRAQWPFPGRCVQTRPNGPLPDPLPPSPPEP